MTRNEFVALWVTAALVAGCGDGSAGLLGGGAGGGGGSAAAGGSAVGAAGAGGAGAAERFDCGGLQFEQRALYSVECTLDLDTLLEPVALDLTAKVYGANDAGALEPDEPGVVTTCGEVELPQETLNLIGNFDPEVTQGFVDFSVSNASPETISHEVPLGPVQALVVISVENTALSAVAGGEVFVEPSSARIAISVPVGKGLLLDLEIPGEACGDFVLQEGSAPLRF